MKQPILFTVLFFIGFSANAQKDTIQISFIEDFTDSTLKNFKYGSTGNKTDSNGNQALLLQQNQEQKFCPLR